MGEQYGHVLSQIHLIFSCYIGIRNMYMNEDVMTYLDLLYLLSLDLLYISFRSAQKLIHKCFIFLKYENGSTNTDIDS